MNDKVVLMFVVTILSVALAGVASLANPNNNNAGVEDPVTKAMELRDDAIMLRDEATVLREEATALRERRMEDEAKKLEQKAMGLEAHADDLEREAHGAVFGE